MPKILLVDDESDILVSLKIILGMRGYDVATSSDGREALAAVESDTPDLVITDYMMPYMDGITLCRRLRARPQTARTPIILTSAAMLDSAYPDLYDSFVQKPAEIDALVKEIKRLLDPDRD